MADEQTQTTDDQQQHQQEPPREEVERQARDIGWQEKERWKGDPEKWVDAPEFLKRGETFVPFLQHDRKRLKGELEQRDQRMAALQEELRLTRESVESLKTFNDQMARERTERRKVEIGAELKAAREAGDDVKVAELQNELGEVVKKVETAPSSKTGNGTTPPQQPQIQPWVKNFLDGNAEFFKNTRKVALFNAIMVERRSAGDSRVGEVDGTALLNEAREEVEKALGGNQRRNAPPRTEESRSAGGGGSSGGSGKGYADLPADARAKCDAQEAKFVGKEGKAFKTQGEWRSHFAKEYFGPSAVAMARTGVE